MRGDGLVRLIHIRRLVQESTGNSRNKVRSLRPVGSKQGQVAIDFYSRWWRAARQLAGLGGGTARGAVPPAALPDVMPAACRAAGRLTVADMPRQTQDRYKCIYIGKTEKKPLSHQRSFLAWIVQ